MNAEEIVDLFDGTVTNAKEDAMGLSEWLGAMKPESVDEGFDNLEGIYKCVVKELTLNEPTQYVAEPHYKLILEVAEVLDGNGSAGRTLRRNYEKTQEESVRKLVNDLFTAGVELDRASESAFEQSFQFAVGKTVYARAWQFAPKDAPDRKMQIWAVKAEKNLAKALAGAKKTDGNLPF